MDPHQSSLNAEHLNQNQMQLLQQLQHYTQGNVMPSGGFLPIQSSTLRTSVNKNAANANANGLVKATATLGMSVPAPVLRNTMLKQEKESAPAPAPAPAPAHVQPMPTHVEAVPVQLPTDVVANPLIGMVKDVIFAMIMNVPALRTKLQAILDNPSLIGGEISKVHDELSTKLSPQELEQLNAYACQDSSRRTIASVMQTAFVNIMADGKIDMSDAPHFLALIHDCITLFSTEAAASGEAVTLNSNTVITFLHFVLKCILILTLDDPEEAAALVMLDGSFKLVKLTVMPLIAGKKWCCFC